MALASFPLIIRRWRRSNLYYGDYAQYSRLREYVIKKEKETEKTRKLIH